MRYIAVMRKQHLIFIFTQLSRLHDLLGGGSSIDAITSENKMQFNEEFSKAIGDLPLVNKYYNLLKPKSGRKRRKKGKRNKNRKRKGTRRKKATKSVKPKTETNQHKPQVGTR